MPLTNRRRMPNVSLLNVVLLYMVVWVLMMCETHFSVEATTTTLLAAYDGSNGAYVVYPAGDTATANVVPRPQPVCAAVDAVRITQQSSYDHPLSVGGYGARISCLSVSGKGTSSCTQAPNILSSTLVMQRDSDGTDVLPPDVIALAQLFNGTIEETYFSATYKVNIFLRLAFSTLSPAPSCSIDVVVAASVASLSAQPAGGLADLPMVTNLDTSSRMWVVNGSSDAGGETATLFLRRLANAPQLVAPARFKFVMIPSNESCQAPNVIQATATTTASTGVTAFYSESVSNVLVKVQLAVPSQSGLYVLCGGKESSAANNATTTTVMLSLAKLRCFENSPPAYAIPPLSWLSPNTVPSGPSSSWTVTFVGSAILAAAIDSAAMSTAVGGVGACKDTASHIAAANATYPLVQSSAGRVVWTVPLAPGTVVTFCYHRGGSSVGWLEVPSYYALDAYSIDRLNENVTLPLPQPGGTGATPSPATTTGAPSATTAAPPTTPTPPTPTIPGGCATASASEIALFGSNSAINFRTSGPWPLQVAASFASFLSIKLCVSINSILLVQVRIDTVWYIQCVVYTASAGSGAYSGRERMAYTVFVLYDTIKQELQDNYLVFGIAAATKVGDEDGTSEDSSITQLIVGVAVAAVVCAVVCLCGLGYLCCKRLRRANEDARHNAVAAAALPHIPQDGITAIPRSAVIQSHARVVLASRAPRLHRDEDDDDSSTDSVNSEVRSTATGRVVDDGVERSRRAPAAVASPGGGTDDEGSMNCDPSVYGPDAMDQRETYLPRPVAVGGSEETNDRGGSSKAVKPSGTESGQGARCQQQQCQQSTSPNPSGADNAVVLGLTAKASTSVSELSPMRAETLQPSFVGGSGGNATGDIEMIEIRDGRQEEDEGSSAFSSSAGGTTLVTSIVVGAPPERSTRRTRRGGQPEEPRAAVDMC